MSRLTAQQDTVLRQMIIDQNLETAQRTWGRAERLARLKLELNQARIELLRARQTRLSAGQRNRSATELHKQRLVDSIRAIVIEIRSKPDWDAETEFKRALLTYSSGIAGLCFGRERTTLAKHLEEIEAIEAEFSRGFRAVPIDIDDSGEGSYQVWCRGVVRSSYEWRARISGEPPQLKPWQWLAGVAAWTRDPKGASTLLSQACKPGWNWLSFDDKRTVAGYPWRKVAPRGKQKKVRSKA